MEDVGEAAVGEDGTGVMCRVCNERPVKRKNGRVCRKCRWLAQNAAHARGRGGGGRREGAAWFYVVSSCSCCGSGVLY